MTLSNSDSSPAERAGDLQRIERALREAVRDALLRHKRDGDPVAVWRDGRVVWLEANEIPFSWPESRDVGTDDDSRQ